VLMCEYAHAMGNSVGNLQEYWEVIRSHRRAIGGSSGLGGSGDQAGSADGQVWYAYGGDFDDEPNDGNFCINGLVGPIACHIRALGVQKSTGASVVTPIDLGQGRIQVRNRYEFADLVGLDISWKVYADGQVLQSGPWRHCTRDLESLMLSSFLRSSHSPTRRGPLAETELHSGSGDIVG